MAIPPLNVEQDAPPPHLTVQPIITGTAVSGVLQIIAGVHVNLILHRPPPQHNNPQPYVQRIVLPVPPDVCLGPKLGGSVTGIAEPVSIVVPKLPNLPADRNVWIRAIPQASVMLCLHVLAQQPLLLLLLAVEVVSVHAFLRQRGFLETVLL